MADPGLQNPTNVGWFARGGSSTMTPRGARRSVMARVGRSAPALGIVSAIVLGIAACSEGAASPSTASLEPVSPSPEISSPSPTTAPTPAPTPTKTPAPTVTPIADAPDSGVVVDLIAKSNRWDTNRLTAPAGMTWSVVIQNQDPVGTEHNFVVVSESNVAHRIFTSERVDGGQTQTFLVPALPAGPYQFVCTLHPNTMTGALTIQ